VYYSTEYDSPVGKLTLASDGQAICGLWLAGPMPVGGVPEKCRSPGSDTGEKCSSKGQKGRCRLLADPSKKDP